MKIRWTSASRSTENEIEKNNKPSMFNYFTLI
jgi:hypothetical protein